MTELLVPNAWVAQQFFTDGQDTFSNRVGIDVGVVVPLDQGNSDALTDVMHGAWDAHLKALTASDCFFEKVVVTDVRTSGAPQREKTYHAAGTAVGDRMPDQVAICGTLRTDIRSKAGRGRIYLAGFAETANDVGGVITAAAKAAAEAYLTQLIGDIVALTYDLGVISKKSPAIGYTGTIHPVHRSEVRDTVWKAQRRRRRQS